MSEVLRSQTTNYDSDPEYLLRKQEHDEKRQQTLGTVATLFSLYFDPVSFAARATHTALNPEEIVYLEHEAEDELSVAS